jgi:hypothetical protein
VSGTNRKILWRLLLAALLLVGQAGAQLHAYAHVASGQIDPAGLDNQPCTDCLSFAPLHSAVGASPCVPPVDPDAATPFPGQVAGPVVVEVRVHGFRSRAPPTRL